MADAEDLTQEIFIHLFGVVKSFKGEAAFTTWLHRVVVNHVLMHFRKLEHRKEEVIEEANLIPETQVAIQDNNVNAIDRITLNRAIAELPTGYRMVFILHDIGGYKHQEIAKRLHFTIHTSKSQLHKARLKLRQILDNVS
jgi:RNA polymerase sigma-70 factor (ECF subfamily)